MSGVFRVGLALRAQLEALPPNLRGIFSQMKGAQRGLSYLVFLALLVAGGSATAETYYSAYVEVDAPVKMELDGCDNGATVFRFEGLADSDIDREATVRVRTRHEGRERSFAVTDNRNPEDSFFRTSARELVHGAPLKMTLSVCGEYPDLRIHGLDWELDAQSRFLETVGTSVNPSEISVEITQKFRSEGVRHRLNFWFAPEAFSVDVVDRLRGTTASVRVRPVADDPS